MRKKISSLLLALMLVLSLSATALAAAYEETYPYGEINVLKHITDEVDALTEWELDTLENQARKLADRYDCWIYAILVEDYREFGPDMKSALGNLYEAFNVAENVNGNAIMLLLSMEERDYYIQDFGSYGQYVMTNFGRESLEKAMLDDLAEDDWYGGLTDYLDQAEVLLEYAQKGTKYDVDTVRTPLGQRIFTGYGIALAVGVIVAFVVCGIFKSQMKTAVIATSAEHYVTSMGPDIQLREDRFTHTTRRERRIESHRSRSGGSDGDSGGGGKF